MSDRMHPIPFSSLVDWALTEWSQQGTVFGCQKTYHATAQQSIPYAGRQLELPLGVAAGPHTQLAQNLAAAYVCGGRVFELKTVQILDGEDLHVSKPCILAEDEGYNCEWSTELTVPQAMEEYVKGWCLLHLLAKELQLGEQDGFVFNMSVGYDLAGIQSEKIDRFIRGLKDASQTDIFQRCKEELRAVLPRCRYMTAEDVDNISPHICNSVTMSTMHGCPAAQIEEIANYLLEEKNLDLYLKCNPTLLGYDRVREALDGLGFHYIQFDREQFASDLQYEDAVPMIRRLWEKAQKLGRFFGVKLTNTFPVQVRNHELPDETMYMSGRTLLPLSLGVAQLLGREFQGKLPISYCGGINAQNVASVYATGISPITVCTDLLKPGGYHRLHSTAINLESAQLSPRQEVDVEAVGRLARTLCGPAGATHDVRRKPVPETPVCTHACKTTCGCCVTLCPNRANVVITVAGQRQMLHLDGLCNECGNCASFCPEKFAPYLEKFTVFCSPEEMENSRNSGFAPLDQQRYRFAVRLNGQRWELDLTQPDPAIPRDLVDIILTVVDVYPYLLYC